MRRSLSARVLGWAFGLCVVGTMSCGQALAAEEERPAVLNTGVTNITEHGAGIEARINPYNTETKYEIWLECAAPEAAPASSCAPIAPQEQGGVIAANVGEQTVTVNMVGLQPSQTYEYRVAAYSTTGRSEVHWGFTTQPLGACHEVCPYKNEISFGIYESSRRYAEGALAREAERKAKAAAEQAEREAKSQMPSQPSTPANVETTPETGNVQLAATTFAVRGGHTSLVRLECLGSHSCHGRLILTAKVPARSGSRHERAHSAPVGIGTFSMFGDEAKTVSMHIDAIGRALLAAGHGRLNATLAIQELAPNSDSTWETAVHLLQSRVSAKK
jgi:hypothetical protein